MDISPAASGVFAPTPVYEGFQLGLGAVFMVVVVTVILTVTITTRIHNRKLKDKEIEERLKQLEQAERQEALRNPPKVDSSPRVIPGGVNDEKKGASVQTPAAGSVPAVGAAPARHTISTSNQPITAPAPASNSLEKDSGAMRSSETFDVDPEMASIMSGVGAPISPGTGEAVAAFLREQARSA